MTTTTTSGRRIVATLAATALAAIGLAAATQSSAQGATRVQNVNVTVTTGSGPVYTNTPVRADFTLANPATNTGNVDVFSIVVPAGVTGVTVGGASGGPTGSVWREALLPCGSRSNCTKILIVYPASFPLSKSFLRPGQSMVASILFTTGSKPGTLQFPFIGIGNGLFTATSTPTITVVSGDAADYAVTGDATVTAGAAGSYAFHAQNVNNEDVPFGGGDVTFTLGVSDDIVTPLSKPKLTYNGMDYGFSAPDGTHQFPWTVVHFDSSGSDLGIYSFTLTLNKAGANSLTAGATGKVSIPQAITVNAGGAATVALTGISDAGGNPDLSAGKNFKASFTLADQFGNPALLTPGTVVFSGLGSTTPPTSLTVNSITGPTYGANNVTAGVINASWSSADPSVIFRATLGSSTSTITKPVVPAETTALISPTGGSVGTGAGCDPTVSTCGTATFPSSTTNTAPFTVSVGVNFCVVGDPCTTGKAQILAVTGAFQFSPSNPASATSSCSASDCPRVAATWHWTDPVDGDFDCIAAQLTQCLGEHSPFCILPNNRTCDANDVATTGSDVELLDKVVATWVPDGNLYGHGQVQASAGTDRPWTAMTPCTDPVAVPVGSVACLDLSSLHRASEAVDAPLLVTWRFIGDPRTHAPSV
jgi:hypothetical protein